MTLSLLHSLLPWLLLAMGLRLFFQLLRQNGRLLLRLEAIEERHEQMADALSTSQEPHLSKGENQWTGSSTRFQHHCLIARGYALQSLGPGAANAINTAGLIVGGNSVSGSATRAFLWRNGVATDLNTLIPANSGWTLNFASGINDRGQIVGWGVNFTGSIHAFLLTPQ